jgi:hypothetical protein
MTPFIVITRDQLLVEAIQRVYVDEHFKYGDNVWFVADTNVTAQEVYRKLMGTLPEKNLTVVVCSVAGYFGIAGKNLWEWLTAKGGSAK